MLKPIRQSLALRTERSKVRITSAKSEMAKAEETAMSGLKVRRASDDPSRWPEISALIKGIDRAKRGILR